MAHKKAKVVPLTKADWIRDCEICNTGLITRIDQLVSAGETIKSASRILAKEAKGAAGLDIISAGAVRGRYRYHKQGRVNWNKTPSADNFEKDFKTFLANLRTATNALRRVNRQVQYKDLDSVRPLMKRVSVKDAIKELTRFLMVWEMRVKS